MNCKRPNKKLVAGLIAASLLLATGITFLIPIPYFAMEPGSAIDVGPFVQVANQKAEEKGEFLLTTISLKEGNVFDYLYAQFSPQVELVPEEQILAGDESEEDYRRRQAENMIASQNNAIIAAYRLANQPVSVKIKGIEIFQLLKNSAHELKVGDLIQKVDHKPVHSTEQLIQYLSTKQVGEVVTIELIRQGKHMVKQVTLIALPQEADDQKRPGLGIIPITRVEVETSPPARIETERIGGPSAGLIFSLEVYNRLLPEDLTRGYRIAGTGTISDDGTVGQIGGIQHKIVAADRKRAQIFFCPRDVKPGDKNEKIARETAKRIGTDMKVVPVSSLKEAVQYLKNLHSQASSNSFQVKNIDRDERSVL